MIYNIKSYVIINLFKPNFCSETSTKKWWKISSWSGFTL